MSILDLNDYLTMAIPNLHQQTRSNFLEVKKNGTIAWYESLPSEKQEAITKLAVKRRKQVMQKTKETEELSQKRQESMKQSHERRRALKAKAQKEQEKLFQEHLIETVTELCEAMNEIDSESIPPSKKKQKLKVL